MPDLSDHIPLALTIGLDVTQEHSDEESRHFSQARLPVLRLPEDSETWTNINRDLANEMNASGLVERLQECLQDRNTDNTVAKTIVDEAVQQVTST